MSMFKNDAFLKELFAPSLGGHMISPFDHLDHHNHCWVETIDAITLTVDAPGITAGNFKIQVDGNILRISGERKTPGLESKFYRSFDIDTKVVDADNIKAYLDNGVLTLTAPKRNEPSVSKTIVVSEAPVEESSCKDVEVAVP